LFQNKAEKDISTLTPLQKQEIISKINAAAFKIINNY